MCFRWAKHCLKASSDPRSTYVAIRPGPMPKTSSRRITQSPRAHAARSQMHQTITCSDHCSGLRRPSNAPRVAWHPQRPRCLGREKERGGRYAAPTLRRVNSWSFLSSSAWSVDQYCGLERPSGNVDRESPYVLSSCGYVRLRAPDTGLQI